MPTKSISITLGEALEAEWGFQPARSPIEIILHTPKTLE